jgi:ATP-dependent helicase/nuclease subunit A
MEKNNDIKSDKIKFTESQEKVISINDTNLLVSASAGSGKTATIIEKIARAIKDGDVKVDELLVVTFTEAASLEMKTRLYNKLVEYAEESNVVREALQKISTADICTLHSFCAKVIRQNFYETDLNASFSVLPDVDSKLLKAQALDKVIEGVNRDISFSKNKEQELYFLISHGLMHLLGFDHQDEEEYNFVIEEQRKALGSIEYDKI